MNFIAFIIAALAIVVIFLIFREVVCWYWKINHTVRLIEDINKKLGQIGKSLHNIGKITGNTANVKKGGNIEYITCFKCGKNSRMTDEFCEHCGYQLE